MKPIHIVMPMGGLNRRFADAGYNPPKPLISVSGEPMIVKALSSFDALNLPKRYTFIIRSEHIANHQLDQLLLKLYPHATIMPLNHNTRGAVETVLTAQNTFKSNEPLIVMDCDLYFQNHGYFQKIRSLTSNPHQAKIGGVLTYFKADNPRFSYCRLMEDLVVETAEKNVISDNAIAGAYYFASSKIFLEAATELLKMPLSETLKEYYLSPLYNLLIKHGYQIFAYPVDEYVSFGTPAELIAYEAQSST